MAGESTPDNSFEFLPLRLARNYRAALLKTFRPYLRGRVAEVGAGIGQFTELLKSLPEIRELLAIEPEARFYEALTRILSKERVIGGTAAQLAVDLDALVSINVLEHVADDQEELKIYHRLLRARQGYICLFTPARKELYAPIDRAFGHYRRYTRSDLAGKMATAKFGDLKIYYFNGVGYFAWWMVFCVMKKQQFNERSIRFFDRIIFPVVFWLESHIAHPPLGQSVVAIGRAG